MGKTDSPEAVGAATSSIARDATNRFRTSFAESGRLLFFVSSSCDFSFVFTIDIRKTPESITGILAEPRRYLRGLSCPRVPLFAGTGIVERSGTLWRRVRRLHNHRGAPEGEVTPHSGNEGGVRLQSDRATILRCPGRKVATSNAGIRSVRRVEDLADFAGH